MSSAVEAAFAGAMLAPCVRAEDVPRRPLIPSLTPRGLTRAARCYAGAKLGVELLGSRGDAFVTRCEYTDPRARLAELATEAGHLPAELARLPQEVIHVRRPITPAEERALPAWFNEAEPVDFAGSGVPIRFP